MERIKNLLKSHPERSKTNLSVMESPIKPRPGGQVRYWYDSPAHVGPYKYALDIIVPDPRINPLPVYAPAGGRVAAIVQNNYIVGETEDYKKYLNYINVSMGNGLFYELCHIGMNSAFHNERLMEVGDQIRKGEKIATTGANGWMTDVRHLHFMVGRWINGGSFESLPIRFEDAPSP